ncbi:MAG: HEAT repeat domain-containing protein [Planctomycetota bacterium]
MANRHAGIILICCFLLPAAGCAEGPLWRAGKYTPWVQNQWEQEEKIADTLFSRKRRISEMTQSAINAPIEDKQRVAESLDEFTERRHPLLLRLHAVKSMGQLNCPAAIESLKRLSSDNSADIRLAAIQAWQNMPADQAIPHLQKMLGSDTNIDVRLAATRALSNFSGQQAVAAISLALDDPDPALQVRATEALQKVTGEQLGRDVNAWQNYIASLRSAK